MRAARYGHVRMSEELSGQVAIVTGGASGIGAATAALLAEAGAAVIVADLNAAKDGAGRFVQHDVTAEESWQALLADVLKREGRLDIMVNNAGISGGAGSVESTDVATWQRVQAVNSEGVFLGCKYAIQGMKRTGPGKPKSKGSIVNLSSVAGLQAGAGSIAYTASKAAVAGMTLTMARDLGSLGIRVNTIAPSLFETGLTARVTEDRAENMTKDAAFPRRMGRPDEYGRLAVAIIENPMLNGDTIRLDGGQRFAPK